MRNMSYLYSSLNYFANYMIGHDIKPQRHLFLISILFIAAFGMRVYHINEPPLDFHPTRQYRSAIIARSYFFERSQSIPNWETKVAIINRDEEGIRTTNHGGPSHLLRTVSLVNISGFPGCCL